MLIAVANALPSKKVTGTAAASASARAGMRAHPNKSATANAATKKLPGQVGTLMTVTIKASEQKTFSPTCRLRHGEAQAASSIAVKCI